MTSLSSPATPASPATQNGHANQRDLTWSRSEKAIARKAFELHGKKRRSSHVPR